MMKRIHVSGPSITEREIAYVTDAVSHAWLSNANVYNERFERAFADYHGVRHAVSLPSCTSALHLSLLALGIGPGDEVIVPDCTWIASAAPISYVGATPVFADIERDTWCLSAEAVEACVTPRTRALIAVDLYGGMPDYEALHAVARRHGIAVIEDAAEAAGSQYRGRAAGTLGAVGTFSFHGSKTLTTGEGGMLITDDDAIYRRVLVLRDHGRQPGDTLFDNREVGYKYKMSSLQAALGLAQIERIEELVARKREIFAWYREALDGCSDITLNSEPPQVRNSYWMVTAVLPARLGGKVAAIRHLAERGIDTRPFFSPLSSLQAYAGSASALQARERNRVCYEIGPHAINLPSGLQLERADVERVARELKGLLASA
ncbi:glutamine--scyllo-inositol aminotransferase [Cupriavidus sp. USMAHM13]|uniref:DegT/DnrJ/EryC1/StrS family aminotransferase n=1 Tax=Cupriavidus sp. USMAHM13 TaxID=1389192 RepID=UPI0008A6CB9A|nr:DegT/DnrJ/EryC1/StrS family aminotransferase [Cupriavidus sp. USMAHM13]AOZ03945.1 glutamine--scyllo-inositol aminotransferase [Cupriavidus sp. USMAHM13]